MNGRERGFLLLTSHLGDPERRPLTAAQLRTLARRVCDSDFSGEDRDLTEKDVAALGYDRDMAAHIAALLRQETLLDHYLARGAALGCRPVTRVSPDYPPLLRQRLGLDSPGCLWASGDLSILNTPAVALVGCRNLSEPNRAFAKAVGIQAAELGVTLISGNARGADRAAQDACLSAGGRVISIVADELHRCTARNLLFLSEDGFDEPFSSQRALSRNRCIHALGRVVFVAQSELQKGGTWSGTVRNLRFGWSPVICFRDGSEASAQLEQMGAFLIGQEMLGDFDCLGSAENFLNYAP